MPDVFELKWDQIGEKLYETGVDRCVLYPQANGAYPAGVAWSGVTNITESPSGAENNDFYADNMKYLSLKSNEDMGLTLECYTSPDEWDECNGESHPVEGLSIYQQKRNTFGLCYRTLIGNDTEGQEHGYKLHLAYGCSAAPSERAYGTVNESPEPIAFSYEVSMVPVVLSGYKPTSLLSIDSTQVKAKNLETLEKILYGVASTPSGAAAGEGDDEEPVLINGFTPGPRLPMPDEVIEILSKDIS